MKDGKANTSSSMEGEGSRASEMALLTRLVERDWLASLRILSATLSRLGLRIELVTQEGRSFSVTATSKQRARSTPTQEPQC